MIVSTIHRAKGLEFDDVYVMDPGEIEDIEDPEELRVVYVALSRARDDVTVFKRPKSRNLRRDPSIDDRWIGSPWGQGQRWKTRLFEVRPTDLHDMHPFGEDATTAKHVQDVLTTLPRGAPAELRFADESHDGLPRYDAVLDEGILGRTGETFARHLRRRLEINGVVHNWPTRIAGLRVEGVETVVGLETEGDAMELGRTGLWLRPRLVGLGHVRWHNNDEEHDHDES